MTDFALGDIVVMKMGGPWMTVVGKGGGYSGPFVECVWYDNDRRLQRDYFETATLKPVELVA